VGRHRPDDLLGFLEIESHRQFGKEFSRQVEIHSADDHGVIATFPQLHQQLFWPDVLQRFPLKFRMLALEAHQHRRVTGADDHADSLAVEVADLARFALGQPIDDMHRGFVQHRSCLELARLDDLERKAGGGHVNAGQVDLFPQGLGAVLFDPGEVPGLRFAESLDQVVLESGGFAVVVDVVAGRAVACADHKLAGMFGGRGRAPACAQYQKHAQHGKDPHLHPASLTEADFFVQP